MKKLLLILIGVVLIGGAQAQVLFEENFSGGVVPIPGWTFMGNVSNLSNPATNYAGGTAPELQFDNDPPFPNTTMRIISPQINTTGYSMVLVRFKHKFEHVSGTSAAFNLKLETRSSNGTWNTVWSAAPTGNIDAQGVNVVVDNANVGAASFQLSFVINGTSQNLKNWFIDNVQVVNPLELDGTISSVNLPALFVGPQDVTGQFANLGTTPITSIDVNWRVDDGNAHTVSYSGIQVDLGGSGDYSFVDQLDLPEGEYDMYIWISNVNGLPADDNVANDTMVRHLSIPAQLVYYKPLFEEFTSSTCGPCATFNNGVFNPFLAQHTDEELTLIKYQMNWPGSGDPYYTAEGGVRRTYYGVNAVPDLYIDGKKTATSASAVNAGFNATAGSIAYVGINSQHVIDGNNIIVDANIEPTANYSNVKVHMAVIEKITTQNVASNGETEFHHVMMKMLPDASGVTANLVANEGINYKYTQNMSSTNVEEMDDLMVAIFIQESDKDIVQSGYSVEVGAFVDCDMQNGAINVPINQPVTFSFSKPVRMVGGEDLTNGNVANLIVFKENDVNGALVGFTATVNDAKTQITVTPNPSLKYNQKYYMQLLPVESFTGVPTQRHTLSYTTLLNIGVPVIQKSEFSIYPNPVNSVLYVKNIQHINTVEIYSIVGNLVKSMNVTHSSGTLPINVSNLPEGLYIIKARGVDTERAIRFVVSR